MLAFATLSCIASSQDHPREIGFFDASEIPTSFPMTIHAAQTPVAFIQPELTSFDGARIFGTAFGAGSQISRSFWLSSFERGATQVNSISASILASTHLSGHILDGVDKSLVLPQEATVQVGQSSTGSEQPGVGACFFAALAIAALAISRRRSRNDPIIPAHLSSEIPITENVYS